MKDNVEVSRVRSNRENYIESVVMCMMVHRIICRGSRILPTYTRSSCKQCWMLEQRLNNAAVRPEHWK